MLTVVTTVTVYLGFAEKVKLKCSHNTDTHL